jgi:hypothetical protein
VSIKAIPDYAIDKYGNDPRQAADVLQTSHPVRIELVRADDEVEEVLILDHHRKPILRMKNSGYSFKVQIPEKSNNFSADIAPQTETGVSARPLYPPALEAPKEHPGVVADGSE